MSAMRDAAPSAHFIAAVSVVSVVKHSSRPGGMGASSVLTTVVTGGGGGATVVVRGALRQSAHATTIHAAMPATPRRPERGERRTSFSG